MKLFQETWRRRPFWMLVGCVLVNRATWAKAEHAHKVIMEMWPTPRHLRDADPVDLANVVRPLGFQNRRTSSLINLAEHWCAKGRPFHVIEPGELPGCGKYAADSWAIFVIGRRDVTPTDKKLKEYMERQR